MIETITNTGILYRINRDRKWLELQIQKRRALGYCIKILLVIAIGILCWHFAPWRKHLYGKLARRERNRIVNTQSCGKRFWLTSLTAKSSSYAAHVRLPRFITWITEKVKGCLISHGGYPVAESVTDFCTITLNTPEKQASLLKWEIEKSIMRFNVSTSLETEKRLEIVHRVTINETESVLQSIIESVTHPKEKNLKHIRLSTEKRTRKKFGKRNGWECMALHHLGTRNYW